MRDQYVSKCVVVIIAVPDPAAFYLGLKRNGLKGVTVDNSNRDAAIIAVAVLETPTVWDYPIKKK